MVTSKLVVGITDCEKYANYERWLLAEPGVETLRVGYETGGTEALHRCHALLFTGGADVHPSLYGQGELARWCDDDMDQRRDEFEWKAMEFAVKNSLSVLGICRGLQLANVYFGGTLVPDLPMAGKFNHSKFREGHDRAHTITIDASSYLHTLTGVATGVVNSAHHQSAGRIGDGLVTSALSPDGVVEALERKQVGASPFLMLVQWHPERMEDAASPLVKNIKQSFLASIPKK